MEQANRDPLTGLFNRRRFQEDLERELAEAERYGGHGALLLLDLDGFTYINDSLGHLAGDELLKSLAVVLRQPLSATDIVARLGGDEFAVLLPQLGPDEALVVARHLLRALHEHRITFGGQRIGVTASIGITLFPAHGTTRHELLSRADQAMHRAKETGRNSLCVYTHSQGGTSLVTTQRTWEERIHDALQQDRFVLHMQPILDLRSQQISQYEALLRMVGDNGELVPPVAFLDVAERAGFMQAIDRWVVRRAIRMIAEYQRKGRELSLGINLSGRAFSDLELLLLIQRELTAAAVNPSRLVLEITETVAITDIDQARRFIETLRELGCRFAIDDFGTGFSSVYYLKHLPVDYVKIDGNFIRNLPRDLVDQQLTRALVEVARVLGKQTIAEFVGDAETVRLLKDYGVDYAQGFYIGKPEMLPP